MRRRSDNQLMLIDFGAVRVTTTTDPSVLTQSIQLNSNDAKSYKYRGLAYCKLKEYEKAIADFTQSIQLSPDNATFYNNPGDAYYSLEEYEKAITDYTQAIQLSPDDATFYNNGGVVY